ncbi:hypothetical protein RFI_06450, partial [Reticulomyxa filosa]
NGNGNGNGNGNSNSNSTPTVNASVITNMNASMSGKSAESWCDGTLDKERVGSNVNNDTFYSCELESVNSTCDSTPTNKTFVSVWTSTDDSVSNGPNFADIQMLSIPNSGVPATMTTTMTMAASNKHSVANKRSTQLQDSYSNHTFSVCSNTGTQEQMPSQQKRVLPPQSQQQQQQQQQHASASANCPIKHNFALNNSNITNPEECLSNSSSGSAGDIFYRTNSEHSVVM